VVQDGTLPEKCEKCGVSHMVKWWTKDVNYEQVKQDARKLEAK
jgi:hypothetical protein